MAYAAKLMNPTPWDVKINYEKGVVIVVPAFGAVDLSMQQFDDYRPNTAGAEAVYEVLDTVGVFLFDTDRSYENQALETLQKTLKKKQSMLSAKVQSYQDIAARQNITLAPEKMENINRQLGVDVLQGQVDALQRFIAQYERVVKKDTARRRSTFDPERTVFAVNPPREFPSVVAREFFLAENPAVAEKEAELRAGMDRAEKENESAGN